MSEKRHPFGIDADIDLIWSRLSDKTDRPLLLTADPYRTLAQLLSDRKAAYGKADIRILAKEEVPKGQRADEVIAAILASPDSQKIVASRRSG